MPDMNDFTYVKLYHKMVEWEWYRDPPVRDAFVHCLLSANRYPKKHRGIMIEAGAFVTSVELFAKQIGFSKKQIRRAWNCLNRTNEITSIGTSQGTLIKVNNWALYQTVYDVEGEPQGEPQGKRRANGGQTEGKPRATNNSNKSNKSNTVIKKSVRTPVPLGEYGHVKLTIEEYERLGNDRDKYVKFLDDYIEEKAYKSKNHNLAIRRWVIDAVEEKQGKEVRGKRHKVDLPQYPEPEVLSEAEALKLREDIASLMAKNAPKKHLG
jgi:hypothetical protein